MTGEELYNAELNQMIEKFDDIPEAHTVIAFERKFDSDAPISLDEKIVYPEALVKLYPDATNKKRWLITSSCIHVGTRLKILVT